MNPAERTTCGILPRSFRVRSRTHAVLKMPAVFIVAAFISVLLTAFALIAALVGTASWGVAKALPRRGNEDPKSYLPPDVEHDRAPRA